MNALTHSIRAAASCVPFYRERARACGLDIETLEFPRDLARFPVTTKSDLIRCAPEERCNVHALTKPLLAESTSGSSGQPFQVRFTRATKRRRRLRFLRGLLSAGYVPGQRLMLLSTRKRVPLPGLTRWVYVDITDREADIVAEYLRWRPTVLYGPMSTLMLLGQMLGKEASAHAPKLLVSTAEELTPLHRQALQSAFGGARIADFYGSTEFGLIAWRARDSEAYRVLAHDLHLEFLPSVDPDLERLVVTDLRPEAMPFIRYETGDLVHRADRTHAAPILRFVGREIDALRLPDGSRLSPYRITLSVESIPSVVQYQVLQRESLALEVLVRTSAPDPVSVFESVRAAIDRVCGGVLDIEVKSMDSTAARAGAKFRPVMSMAGGAP
jgi:phenylacetate-CoA ligase